MVPAPRPDITQNFKNVGIIGTAQRFINTLLVFIYIIGTFERFHYIYNFADICNEYATIYAYSL